MSYALNIAPLDHLTREIADRIAPSCAHLSRAELNALSKKMASVELKYLFRVPPTIVERLRPEAAPLTKCVDLLEGDPSAYDERPMSEGALSDLPWEILQRVRHVVPDLDPDAQAAFAIRLSPIMARLRQ